MRIAHPVGLSADGELLVVETDDGEYVGVPADERLRAALRRDRPRMGQLEIDMDSALRPREIQDRIRSGQTLDEVARAAGVPVEKVEPYAVPVLAERAHTASAALTASVRRRGETHGHRTLRQVVQERLLSRGIDPDTVEWDAWRNEDRRWTVRAAYRSGTADREATFLFDKAARFSTSTNDDARWLLGEPGPAIGPQTGGQRPRFDDSDELALVRAVADEDDESPPEDEDASAPTEGTVPSSPQRDEDPSSTSSPQEIAEEVEAELDAFDVIPQGRSELDVLYDMLGGINEDSINIYAGLDQPVTDDSPEPNSPQPNEAALRKKAGLPRTSDEAEATTDAPVLPPTPAASDTGAPVEIAARATEAAPSDEPHHAPEDSRPAQRRRRPSGSAVAPSAEPEQPSLVDEPQPAAGSTQDPGQAPRTRSRRKKGRASVPSWDEIMFGGPPPKP